MGEVLHLGLGLRPRHARGAPRHVDGQVELVGIGRQAERVGGVALVALYFGVFRDALTTAELANPALQPSMQVTRGLGIAASGLIASFAARGLRNAIGRAERTQRQRDLFGKYRLLREIAAGGMGTVHEALYCPQGGFERRVAVKTIHPHLASESRFVEAFRREAELTARLAHPNIVQVLDFGQVEATYFLAMEYVDGTTLLKLTDRSEEPLPTRLVAHLAREILNGLQHAHSARGHDGEALRIVHRDLCPSNILLSSNGEVKITDYGVAKALHDATSAQTASVVGHYGYMAPEQVRSEPLDERVDLFAIGVVLWELLTGRRLFKRNDVAATLLAVVDDDVEPPSRHRADLDPRWDALVGRALTRDPDARFSSATAMLTEVEALLEDEGGAWPEGIVERVKAAHSDSTPRQAGSRQQS